MNRRTPHAALTAILLSSLVFTACSRADAPSPGSAEPAPPAAAAAGPSRAATAPTAGATPGAAGPMSKDERPLPGSRMIVSEARLSIRSTDPEVEADSIGRYAADVGGYVVTREADRSDSVATKVEMAIRVPATKFEMALSELRRHGTVLAESATGHDVTEEFTDTEAQLKSKRRLEERLLHIVDGSGSVKDMLEVENELTRVRTDIERLEGRSRLLVNQAAFATIHATFESPAQPIVRESESTASHYANAFRKAGSAFVYVTAALIVATGALVPAALPAGVAYLVWRRRRRIVRTSVA